MATRIINRGTYGTLVSQLDKLARHNRQGSFRTKGRYYEAFKRFCAYLADTYHLQKLENISGKHLTSYVLHMQGSGKSASTIKTDLAAIRFFHDKMSQPKYQLPTNDELTVELERRRFGGVDRTWSTAEFNKMLGKALAADRYDYILALYPYEAVFLVILFTGLRQGEVLGLTWECVDFAAGTVLISKQLQKMRSGDRGYYLASTKSGKSRKLTPAPSVMKLLRHQQAIQAEWRLRAGAAWQDSGLVFTNKLGGHLMPHTVYQNYKKVVASIGRPDARFHDLRHSYAVAAIRGDDDIKTVQGNMGHATAAFTLDVYGHVTDQMKQASAARMEKFIQSVSGR